MNYPAPKIESDRLTASREHRIPDAPAAPLFDDLTKLAARICDAPISLLALLDGKRRQIVSQFGSKAAEISPEIFFSVRPNLETVEVFIVEDTAEHPDFTDDLPVKGAPHVRFYAAAPLVSSAGFALGWLCVIDEIPRKFSAAQAENLQILARQVVSQIELRDSLQAEKDQYNESDTKFSNQKIARDSAEHQKIRHQLDASENRFRDFVNQSLALFCTHHLDGTILSVNPALTESLGYDESEMVGQNIGQILKDEARELVSDYLDEIRREGKVSGLVWILTKDGERRIWSYSNRLLTDADGTPFVLASAQDVTELKLKEEELVKSQNIFESFMQYNPALISLKDEDGKFIFVNQTCEELFLKSSAELKGKTIFDLFSAEEARQVIAHDTLAREKNTVVESVLTVTMPDGKIHHLLDYKFPIETSSGGKLLGGIALDITERKLLEDEMRAAHDAALESVRLKSAFLTNVSHEIRTPMNGVIGMTELLLDTPLDRTQRGYAESIRNSGDDLLTVINDVLDLAKIEAGKLRFEAVDFDLRETVESTVESFADRAQRKNVELSSFIEPDVPQILRGDPGRLRQILTNLLGNAVKFTDHGEIGLKVEIERDQPQDLILRLTVTDTGIGIGKKHLKNLFQPFMQADNSTTRQFGGTGLGLVISKQLVEMMNGEIIVESKEGAGSEFSFTACFDKTAGNNGKKMPPNLIELLQSKKILIADEREITRRTLKEYVGFWGINAVEASSGEETLQKLADAANDGKPFDAAVIDMNLPDWEGFALARRIKTDEFSRLTQIILTTANGQRGDAAEAQEVGAEGYLTKPVRGSSLFDCLTAVFSLREQNAEKQSDSLNSVLVTRHSLRESGAGNNLPKFERQDFNLLVVEDNETNRRMVYQQLKKINLTADFAVDGEDALQKINSKNYRVILMDCQMPKLDGYQAAREIRRLENKKNAAGVEINPAAIIALTAHSLAGEREKCLAAGMDDYLSKPVKISQLATVIEFWSQTEPTGERLPGTSRDLTIETRFADDGCSPDARSPEEFEDDFSTEIEILFRTETARQINELTAAYLDNNLTAIAQLAHAIRGNALSVGKTTLAPIANLIETAAKTGDTARIPKLIETFQNEFAELI